MRWKAAVVALSLSLVCCVVSRAGFADTLTLTGVGGQNADDEFVFPYLMTVTGSGGTTTLVDMSCLNFARDVSVGETWDVETINMATITPSEIIDGESGTDLLADAYLYNQYSVDADNAQDIADLQFAIWSIMDPSMTYANTNGALDANAQALAATAFSLAPTLPSSYFANDIAFIPIDSYPNGGEPQIFITDPTPPAVTPEPTSLILLGTGLFGAVAVMRRRKLVQA